MNRLAKKILSFFRLDGQLSLENRLYLSSLLIGIVLCFLGILVTIVFIPSIFIISVCLALASVLFVLYYLGRSKGLIRPFVVPIVLVSFMSIFVIWVKGGGINGPNIFPNFLVLILALIIVPAKFKKFTLIFFLGLVFLESYIEMYYPQIIEGYPTEFARWADSLFTTAYSAVFIYFIVISLHKHYTTERKKAEENEFKFRILYDRSPDMYYSISPDEARIINCNNTFTKTLGYTREEVIGKPIFDFMDPSVRDFALESFGLFLKSGSVKNREFTILKKNGEKMVVSLNAEAVRDDENKILYSISSWREITDQKIVEQNLRNTNELLSLFIKQSPIYAFIKDVTPTESRIIYLSDNYENMVGINGSDLIGKTVAEIYEPDFAREIMEQDWQVVLSGQVMKVEQRLNNKIYSTIKFPIAQEGRNLLAGYSIDITDQVNTSQIIQEQNLELQKLNSDKDMFISILAHDLKSPFNALLGFSKILTENVRIFDLDKIEKQLKLINYNSHKAYNLLEDILLWTRAHSGKLPFEPQSINLYEICQEVTDNISLSAIQKNIQLEANVDNETFVLADKNMFTTILRNLLSNAVKFTNCNGHIAVTSSVSGEHVVISVADNGVGMDEEKIVKLFDFSLKQSSQGTEGEHGTGFGLLLCKEFTDKHGGEIWAESKPGKGSIFRFTMPVAG